MFALPFENEVQEFVKPAEKIKRSSEFGGINRCQKLRKYDNLVFSDVKNINYDRAVAAKEILRMWFRGECKPAEFRELISEAVGIDEDADKEYIKVQRERLVTQLTRYTSCEKRKPAFVSVSREIKIPTTGDTVRVSSDAVFDDGKEIEVVLFRASKPSVSVRGRKKDAGINTCIELYLLCLLGRTLVPAGEKRDIKASYYFLRKEDDFKTGTPYNWEFFNDSNVVSLSDKGDETDEHFRKEIDDFFIGEEHCSEDDCKKCALNAACHYQKQRELFEDKNLNAKNGTIVPSESQQKVIDFRKGVCRVNATAGSGKTESVTERAARITEEGTPLANQMIITFTEAGAREIRERIVKKLAHRNIAVSEEDLKYIGITFHNLEFEIVKENYMECGYTKPPVVVDDNTALPIVDQLINETVLNGLNYGNYYGDNGSLESVYRVLNLIKERNLDVTDQDAVEEGLKDTMLVRVAGMPVVSQLIPVYQAYDKALKEENLITYADMENLAAMILSHHPGYLEKYGIRHLIVDEFQDTSDGQMDIVKKMKDCTCCESVMVVGDDSQSIYSFRNTSNKNIINYFDILGVKEEDRVDIMLGENRRSVGRILKLANDINNLNKEKIDKDMIAVREDGEKVAIRGFHSKKTEYRHIAMNIKKLIDDGRYTPEDICFMSFKRADMLTMSAELSKLGIPFVVKTPLLLKDNSRVQAALALAEAFYQPDAERLYFNYLVAKYDGEILNEDQEVIKEEVKKMRSQFEGIDLLDMEMQQHIIHDYLDAIAGNDEIYDHFLSLVYAQEDFPSEIRYLHNFNIYGRKVEKKMEQKYTGVVLTTVHSAKGLEWPVCFLSVSSFDNKTLHKYATKSPRFEEMRRLLFVAITRARDLLSITGEFICGGNAKEGYIYNRFLKELYEVNDMYYTTTDPLERMKDTVAKLKRRKKLSPVEQEDLARFSRFIKNAEDTVVYDFEKQPYDKNPATEPARISMNTESGIPA